MGGISQTFRAVRYLYIFLIMILGIAVYASGVNGKFIWDDEVLIRNNSYIRDFSNIESFFLGEISDHKNSLGYSFYRPMQMVSYALDYKFWKLNPKGYHLTNILFHILSGLCIFWLVSLLYKDETIALFTSLFFIVHPMHTEVVSYVAGRSDSLVTVFLLLSFVFYLKNKTYFSSFSYLMALLSRETALIFPFLLLAYSFINREKIKRQIFIPISILSAVYLILRLTLLKFLLVSSVSSMNFAERLPGVFAALAGYLKVLVFPFFLHMEYGDKQFSILDTQVLSGIILFILLCYVIIKKKKDSCFSFSLLWFCIGIVPVLNLYPVSAYMAEHWLYFPSIGVFIILGKYLSSIYRKENLRKSSFLAITLFLFLFSYLTMRQDSYWTNPIVFYERTLKYSPDNWKVYNNLGIEYYRNGYRKKAIEAFERSIKINPKYEGAYRNLERASKNH